MYSSWRTKKGGSSLSTSKGTGLDWESVSEVEESGKTSQARPPSRAGSVLSRASQSDLKSDIINLVERLASLEKTVQSLADTVASLATVVRDLTK